MEEYRVIRSARKTLSLEITEDLTVLVRAPYQVSQSRIEAFVAGQQDWIAAHRERCPSGALPSVAGAASGANGGGAAGLHRPRQGNLTPKGGILWPLDGADAHGADHHRCSEAVRQL